MALLEVKNISQFYGKKKILNNVSFEVDAGKVVVFLGPNGAGKTTLLKTVIGLISSYENDDKNKIIFDGNIINRFSIASRVEKGIVYLPQQPSLFFDLTVEENLKLVYQYHIYWNGKNILDFYKEQNFWIDRSTLSESLSKKIFQLSGGQIRKAEVVRALLMHPKVILLDEPFAGVDPKSISELKLMFSSLAKEGMAVLISDHNVNQLLSIADTVYVIIAGEVVTFGKTKDIMQNDYTRQAYFGDEFFQEISTKYMN